MAQALLEEQAKAVEAPRQVTLDYRTFQDSESAHLLRSAFNRLHRLHLSESGLEEC